MRSSLLFGIFAATTAFIQPSMALICGCAASDSVCKEACAHDVRVCLFSCGITTHECYQPCLESVVPPKVRVVASKASHVAQIMSSTPTVIAHPSSAASVVISSAVGELPSAISNVMHHAPLPAVTQAPEEVSHHVNVEETHDDDNNKYWGDEDEEEDCEVDDENEGDYDEEEEDCEDDENESDYGEEEDCEDDENEGDYDNDHDYSEEDYDESEEDYDESEGDYDDHDYNENEKEDHKHDNDHVPTATVTREEPHKNSIHVVPFVEDRMLSAIVGAESAVKTAIISSVLPSVSAHFHDNIASAMDHERERLDDIIDQQEKAMLNSLKNHFLPPYAKPSSIMHADMTGIKPSSFIDISSLKKLAQVADMDSDTLAAAINSGEIDPASLAQLVQSGEIDPSTLIALARAGKIDPAKLAAAAQSAGVDPATIASASDQLTGPTADEPADDVEPSDNSDGDKDDVPTNQSNDSTSSDNDNKDQPGTVVTPSSNPKSPEGNSNNNVDAAEDEDCDDEEEEVEAEEDEDCDDEEQVSEHASLSPSSVAGYTSGSLASGSLPTEAVIPSGVEQVRATVTAYTTVTSQVPNPTIGMLHGQSKNSNSGSTSKAPSYLFITGAVLLFFQQF